MIQLLIILFVVALYFYGTRNFDYFSKRGIQFEKPIFFFGGYLKQHIDKVSLSERFAILHRAFPDEKFVGFFEGNTPAILVSDIEIIKHVLLTDFRDIHHRGIIPRSEFTEPLMRNLFTVDGDVWKLMRQKLTPAFSSAKLKAMFPLIVEMTEKLSKLADEASAKEEADVRELMARYTTDFIGACGFGIDSNSLSEENSDFRKLGKRIFNLTIRDLFFNVMKRVFPTVFKHARYFPPEVENKTMSIVRQIMAERNYQPSGRNDFMDMLLEIRQKGKIVGESIEQRNHDGSPAIVALDLDDELLAAQIFVFFAAGFETSSAASSYFLHMLAYHPEVQKRCQREVDEVLAKHDGKLCFDAVREMKYLEMAFRESLRCLPSPGFLIRRTTSNYTIPGSQVTLDEGTVIVISTEALSSSDRYFDDPEEFRPERFHPDNIGNIKKCTFMPFGDGPRSCIGERLGMMQSMAGAATILSRFTVAPSRSSVRKPRVDPKSILVQNIIGGLPLALKRRNNKAESL
ncbi:cytochrome P450 6B6-like [Pararge aegeria]|uniref:unspecific monooxygenase n=1 Tax=Pararge aegeria aegeria TaxID=348720 RepID=A0A8S4SQ13_9NEOP|nr:cytochrome P450 6B6-like [Pararge aegeria]CAH2269073.1 jg27021 [Pararge aegeria aegeria]